MDATLKLILTTLGQILAELKTIAATLASIAAEQKAQGAVSGAIEANVNEIALLCGRPVGVEVKPGTPTPEANKKP